MLFNKVQTGTVKDDTGFFDDLCCILLIIGITPTRIGGDLLNRHA